MDETRKIEIEGKSYEVTVGVRERRGKTWRRPLLRSLVSVSLTGEIEHFACPQKPVTPHEAAREMGLEHGWTHRGDHPELDKIWDRFNQGIFRSMRAVVKLALTAWEVSAVVPE